MRKKIILLILGLTLIGAGIYVATDRNVVALTLGSGDEQAATATLSKTQTQNVVGWIKKLQYTNSRQSSFGAITVSDGVAVYEEGTETPLRRVTPYFSHLAVLGVLDAGQSGSVTMAQRWIQWYTRHIDATAGVPLDTWYSLDGAYSTTCPVKSDERQCNTVDAEDSSAALFLVVVDRYITAGGSKSFVRSNKSAIRNVEDTLTALIDVDGVSWAKKTYPIKYLMDNVEVLAGLEAAARIEKQIFSDTARAKQLSDRAAVLKTALYGGSSGSFYNASTTQYAIYKDGAGVFGHSNMKTWYPDIMAQLWPTAFGQTATTPTFTRAITALKSQLPPMALEKGDCNALKSVTGDAHAPVIAYTLRKTKFVGADLLTECMYSNMQPTYTWPVTAADAGWLLRR
ncbi:MAG: hypothetical protein ACK4SL_03715 [Candidatus Paceibacteria bacterium]